MTFYGQIADVYDDLFPLNEKQLFFIEKALGNNLNGKNILDVGCGTGSLSIAMARRSAKVRAFDYDDHMIEKANNKRPQALNLIFKQGDMHLLSQIFPNSAFNAILCFGNTLVHLGSANEVSCLFKDVAGQLLPGGAFMFSIVNYDRILSKKIDFLPTIETDDYIFERKYHYRPDGRIDFNTELRISGGEVIKNTVVLMPLKKEDVEHKLESYFSSVNFYGGFDRSEWNSESFHLVVEAIR